MSDTITFLYGFVAGSVAMLILMYIDRHGKKEAKK